jgi:MATE family multidrug resistance protein
VWSAPFALGNYVMLGWLVGLARARTAMAVQIAINVINMLTMGMLVLGLGLGIAGAALASVIAEVAGLVLGLAVAWRALGGRIGVSRPVLFQRERLIRMLSVNRDIMLRTAALITAFFFFTAQGAWQGDVILAANSVLHNFTLLGAFFLDGLAAAAEQLCGQAVGARDRKAFDRAVRLVVGWGAVFGIGASLLEFGFGAPLIDAMTTSPDVRAAARDFLWLAALAPAAGVMAFCYDGIFIGATWARDMRNLMLAALATYFAVWWLLQSHGNTGLWIAILVFFLARGAYQAARYPSLLRIPFR